MTNQYDAFGQSVEDDKKKEGIDQAIMADGLAKGKNITPEKVQTEFDGPFVELIRRLTPPPLPPQPPQKPKESPDADR